jgi:1-acyl-sn-glycerol-3-phosphate acyltransferase
MSLVEHQPQEDSKPPLSVVPDKTEEVRIIDLDTDFARRWPSRIIRAAYTTFCLRPMRAIFCPTTVVDRDRVADLNGPAVFAANHSSHADTMVLSLALPRRRRSRLVVAAAADYFFTKRRTAVFSAITVPAIPVQREKVQRKTLDLCNRLLGEGWSVLLYPEGGRSSDGELREFKPGAAWIARRAGVPVVPTRLIGTYDVLPKGRSFPRRNRVEVRFGEPLVVEDGESAKEFNVRIEKAVRSL